MLKKEDVLGIPGAFEICFTLEKTDAIPKNKPVRLHAALSYLDRNEKAKEDQRYEIIAYEAKGKMRSARITLVIPQGQSSTTGFCDVIFLEAGKSAVKIDTLCGIDIAADQAELEVTVI